MKEAQYYQIKYGGHIHRVSDTTYEDEELSQEEKDEGIIERVSAKRRELYILVNKVETHLEESFNPIKDLIYDMQLLKLWKLFKNLTENNIKVYGIKTDCLLINETKKELKTIDFNNEIGGVKFEISKKPINKKIMFFDNLWKLSKS